jgi:hypothetical protein
MTDADTVLGPSKRRTIFFLFVCMMFVAIGVKALGENSAIGWLCTVFFGLGAVVFAVQLPVGVLSTNHKRGI